MTLKSLRIRSGLKQAARYRETFTEPVTLESVSLSWNHSRHSFNFLRVEKALLLERCKGCCVEYIAYMAHYESIFWELHIEMAAYNLDTVLKLYLIFKQCVTLSVSKLLGLKTGDHSQDNFADVIYVYIHAHSM